MNYLSIAQKVFLKESQSIIDVSRKLDENFTRTIESILEGKGRVIVCGMGKSGIVGKKIAATLASTGTPSFFMHPGEAYHGDLGMVTADDVFIAISNSGETEEVVKLLPFLRSNRNLVIAMTGNSSSTLAESANFHLNIGVEEEACPLQLAPTSSTTATMAMGDALAVTLMEVRGFAPESFARFHPGGSLGRRLLRKVSDEMVVDNLPFITGDEDVLSLISIMSTSQQGMAVCANPSMIGVITDGDLRRAIEEFGQEIFVRKAKDFISYNPITVPKDTRVEDALNLMEQKKVTKLLVVDLNQVIGIFRK